MTMHQAHQRKYHHFRSYVANGEVKIEPVGTEDQLVDMLTKANNLTTLKHLRKGAMGW